MNTNSELTAENQSLNCNNDDDGDDDDIFRTEQGLVLQASSNERQESALPDANYAKLERYVNVLVSEKIAGINKSNRFDDDNDHSVIYELQDLRGQVHDLQEEMSLLRVELDQNTNIEEEDYANMQENVSLLQQNVDEHTRKLEQDDGEPLLPEDSYSFLALTRTSTSCRHPGRSFLVSLGIFAFQIFTLSLLAVDVVDRENKGNVLDIPGGVDTQVRIAQLIALIITVISQDEVRQSLNVFYNGYNPTTCENEFGSSSKTRWYLSIACRFLAGCLGLAVTFMLLITVDSVRELLLNFTAVEFVSNVDDTIFLLSKWGYFGTTMKRDAESVADARLDESATKSTRPFPRTLCLSVIFLGLLGPWLYLSYEQEQEAYLPSYVYVQFGDEFSPALGTFSGVYKAAPRPARIFSGERVDYVAFDHSAKFVYCRDDRVWAFFYGETSDAKTLSCKDKSMIRAVSSETFTFDITDTATDSWFLKDAATGRDVPLQHFSLSERTKVVGQGCSEKDNDDEDGFECDKDDTWSCRGSLFGVNCQYPRKPCEVLEIDEQYHPFADARSWSSRYDIALMEDNSTIAQAYGRPIYIGNVTQNGEFDVMFFVGRRWVLTRTDLIEELREKKTVLKSQKNDFNRTHVTSVIANDFHAHWMDFQVVFVSEPSDIDTPTDIPTPVGLNWFRAKAFQNGGGIITPLQAPDMNQEEATVLLCAICDEAENPCVHGNCVKDNGNIHTCKCKGGTFGKLCQILPLGDGRCNPDFNTPGYDFDDGDCCPFTCVSTEHNACGMNETVVFGLELQEYVGFPNCKDESQISCEDGQPCWKLWTELGDFENVTDAGSFGVLSGNGQVVAVREPGVTSQIRVFVNDGKNWRQRGPPVRIDANVRPDPPYPPIVPSVVALSRDGSTVALVTNNTIKAYHWNVAGNEWSQLGRNILHPAGVRVDAVALSSDGRVLVAHAQPGYASLLVVYKYVFGEGWHQLGQSILVVHENPLIKSLSLSGDGTTLAIGEADSGYGSNATISVFKYSKLENFWVSVGPVHSIAMDEEKEARNFYGNNTSLMLHDHVALSANGQVLAVGRVGFGMYGIFGLVVAFTYNSDETWTVKGNPIMRFPFDPMNDLMLASLSLDISGDGSSVAVGVTFQSLLSFEQSHIVLVSDFDNETGQWLEFERFNDGLGTSVALSQNAAVLLYGAPKQNLNGAATSRVMWRKPPDRKNNAASSIDESIQFANITVEIQLDDAPWETSLRLDCNDESYGRILQGALSMKSKKGTGVLKVPKGGSCTFEIEDFEGDGICSDWKRCGNFSIYYGDTPNRTTLLAEGGQLFGSRELVSFQVKDPAYLGLVPIWLDIHIYSIQDRFSLNLTCGDILKLSALEGAFEWSSSRRRVARYLLPKGTYCELTMEGGYALSKVSAENDTNILLERYAVFDYGGHFRFIVPGCGCKCLPKAEIPMPLECGSEEKLLRLELSTSEYGARVEWEASLESDDEEIDQQSLTDLCSTYVFQRCISNEECVNFEISNTPRSDRKSINYTLFFENNTIASDTNFQGYKSSSAGDACSPTASPTGYEACDDGDTPLRVELTLDWEPGETSWQVRDIFQNIVLQSEDYSYPEHYAATVVRQTCVPEESCFLFDIHDPSGICCDRGMGSYTVSYGSYQISGGIFEESEQRLIGDCDGVTMAPTGTPIYTPQPTLAPSQDLSPPSVVCNDTSALLYIEVRTDDIPEMTSFAVLEFDGSRIFLSQGPFEKDTDKGTIIRAEDCVPDDVCLLFVIIDETGDGICCGFGEGYYKVFLDNKLILEGGEFEYEEARFFGNCESEAPTISPQTFLPSSVESGVPSQTVATSSTTEPTPL